MDYLLDTLERQYLLRVEWFSLWNLP